MSLKIYYDLNEKQFHTPREKMFNQCLQSKPKWWDKITPLLNGYKSFKKFVFETPIDFLVNKPTFATVKTCPGIIDLFKQSLVLKFPHDIIIEILDDGRYIPISPSQEAMVSFHNPDQAPGFSDNFVILKICSNFVFTTNKDSQVMFVNPLLYKDQSSSYQVVPGVVKIKKNRIEMANVIVAFPKKAGRYYFEAGEPIALMTFDEPIQSVTQKDFTAQVAQVKHGNHTFFNRRVTEDRNNKYLQK